jgi:hypothetical protein
MNIDLSETERDLLTKIMRSYLSELRGTIAATRGTSDLHAEEEQINALLAKLSRT